MITMPCSGCQSPLRVADASAGKRVRCPRCGRVVLVPAEDDPTLPPGVSIPGVPRGILAAGPDGTQGRTDGGSAAGALNAILSPPQGPGELGRLGPYRVLEILGAGGMGVVYRADDPQLKRQVALKAILPHLGAGEVARKRFLREAQSAAAIEHDHIVTVYQVGEDRGIPFLAMQFLKGESLAHRLERERILPAAEVRRIGRETALGLAAAHQHGLIHRDIKPANLWLEGAAGRVKILDFGLARAAANDAGRTQLTRQGAIVGTPAYMAPEQANGQGIDARADLFSLGCVLYRMATGTPPFQGPDAVATLLAVATESPRPPHEVNPKLAPGLSDLITRLLAKDPAKRPMSAQAVADALRDPEEKNAGARPITARPSGRGRFLLPLGLGATATVFLAVGVASFFLPRGDPEKEPDTEPTPAPIAQPAKIPPGRRTLVLQPTPLPGVQDWTIEPRGHRGAVKQGAYSPDSRRLASGGTDGTVRLWDAATGRLQRIFLGHDREVAALAWSPDGQKLASGDLVGTVRLWDADSGLSLHTLAEHSGKIHFLRWSDDGLRLASASADKSVMLWDAASGKRTQEFTGHGDPVLNVYWRPDGKTLVSSSYPNGKRCLWDAKSGKVLQSTVASAPSTWSPEYKVLVYKAGKKTVGFWEADSGRVSTLPLKGLAEEIRALSWSRDEKTLATGTGTDKEGEFQLWDAQTGKLLHSSKGAHNSRCDRLVYSYDGKLLLTHGVYDYNVKVWNAETGKLVRRLARNYHVGNGDFSPDGRRVKVVTAGESPTDWVRHTLDVWELSSLMRWQIPLYRADSQEVSWSPDGKRVAFTSVFSGLLGWKRSAAQIRIWDAEADRPTQVLSFAQTKTGTRHYPSAWSPDGRTLATTAADFGIQLWDPVTGTPRGTLNGRHTTWVHALAWSPDGKTLASFAGEGWLWDPAAGKALRPLTGLPKVGQVVALAWSPDGKTLASVNRDWNDVALWDVASGELRIRLNGHQGRPEAVAWSPDGKMLASGDAQRIVHVWQPDTGKSLSALKDSRQGQISALAWLDNGRVATLSKNSRLCLWDVAGEKIVLATRLPGAGRGRFSPDGRLLASVNDLAGVRLWETATGRPRGTLFFVTRPEPSLPFVALSADGHYFAEPPRLLDREFVYVVRTDRGQDLLTPKEFAKTYRHTNDPSRVRLLGK